MVRKQNQCSYNLVLTKQGDNANFVRAYATNPDKIFRLYLISHSICPKKVIK